MYGLPIGRKLWEQTWKGFVLPDCSANSFTSIHFGTYNWSVSSAPTGNLYSLQIVCDSECSIHELNDDESSARRDEVHRIEVPQAGRSALGVFHQVEPLGVTIGCRVSKAACGCGESGGDPMWRMPTTIMPSHDAYTTA